jgi:hypothetical protein
VQHLTAVDDAIRLVRQWSGANYRWLADTWLCPWGSSVFQIQWLDVAGDFRWTDLDAIQLGNSFFLMFEVQEDIVIGCWVRQIRFRETASWSPVEFDGCYTPKCTTDSILGCFTALCPKNRISLIFIIFCDLSESTLLLPVNSPCLLLKSPNSGKRERVALRRRRPRCSSLWRMWLRLSSAWGVGSC